MQENSNLISRQEGNQNTIYNIKWKSLLWMLFGWSINWGLGWEIGLEIDKVIRNSIEASYGISFDQPSSYDALRVTVLIGLFIGGLFGGAGAGTSVAWVLRKEKVIKSKTSYLLLVIGWSICGGIGLASSGTKDLMIGFILSGLIGGGFLVWALWKEKVLNNKLSIILIPLGWSVGLIAGFESFDAHWVIYLTFSWLASGIIIAWAVLPQIEFEKRKHVITQIIRGWLIGGMISFAVWALGYALLRSISGTGDSPVLALFLFFIIISGLVVGIIVSLLITLWVLSKEETITYMQMFIRIGIGLLIIGLIIGVIVWTIINTNAMGFNFERLFNFITNNAVSGVIGWGIMLLVLRKKEIQK